MLHILFVILKILGILLASILGLLLLLLLIVLFVPIRYWVEGKKHEDTAIRVRVHWLLGIVRFYYDFINGKQQFKLRIFGIPFKDSLRPKHEKKKNKKNRKNKNYKSKKLKKKEKSKSNEVNKNEMRQEQPETSFDHKESNNNSLSQLDISDDSRINVKLESETEKKAEQSTDEKNKQTKQTKLYRILKKYKDFIDRILHMIQKIKKIPDKMKEIKEKIVSLFQKLVEKKNKIRDFWQEETNRLGMKKVFAELIKLLKHCGPQKLKGKIRFGLSDPSATGKILGAVAVVYARYGAKLDVEPDFEHVVFEIDVAAKGRIRIFSLLIIVLRLKLDKNFKEFWKNAKRLKEEL